MRKALDFAAHLWQYVGGEANGYGAQLLRCTPDGPALQVVRLTSEPHWMPVCSRRRVASRRAANHAPRVEIEPGKRYSAICEYTDRVSDEELLRVGDYLRLRGYIGGPGPNAVLRRRKNRRDRIAALLRKARRVQ